MRYAISLLVLVWSTAVCAEPTFSEAIGLLKQERSYAESGAALVKSAAPEDVAARRLYAEAKASFDGLIEQLLADLAQNRDPNLSPVFRDRLDAAVNRRVAFSTHVNELLRTKVSEGAKGILVDALAKSAVELIKLLFDSGLAIWKEWRDVISERRKQIVTLIESERWKPFSEIAPAL
jgi:hypothetical protein